MSAYADIARVKTILDAEVEPDLTTFDALNATASAELDAACRVSGFGTEPEPRTLTFCPCRGSGPVVLDPPALTVSAVDDNGTTVAAEDYRLVWPTYDRYWGLVRAGWTYPSGFSGPVAVTGAFADLPPGPVPPEIVEAASVLVAGYLRRDRTPAGEVSGPEGLTFRPSNPWSDERVKRAVARYRLPPLPV
ncbi:MAG TPA: hypothetical protein VH475_22195 [Tepidisphaeraceae bacterium]|jgi:hypothetical protein